MNAIVRQNLSEASELWKSGKSITEIANMYGVSRQSIAGFMNRNRGLFPKRKGGLTVESYSNGAPARSSRRVNIQRVRRAKKEAVQGMNQGDERIEFYPTAYDNERKLKAKTFLEIGQHECRWPLMDGQEIKFCSAATEATYCTHHSRRAYRVRFE